MFPICLQLTNTQKSAIIQRLNKEGLSNIGRRKEIDAKKEYEEKNKN
jgi:hypothetical protein